MSFFLLYNYALNNTKFTYQNDLKKKNCNPYSTVRYFKINYLINIVAPFDVACNHLYKCTTLNSKK